MGMAVPRATAIGYSTGMPEPAGLAAQHSPHPPPAAIERSALAEPLHVQCEPPQHASPQNVSASSAAASGSSVACRSAAPIGADSVAAPAELATKPEQQARRSDAAASSASAFSVSFQQLHCC